MLKAVLKYKGKTFYIDFTKSFTYLNEALFKIDQCVDPIGQQIKKYDFHFTNDSGGLYHSIRELATPEDNLLTVYKCCAIASRIDKPLLQEIEKNITDGKITSLRDIDITTQILLMKESQSLHPQLPKKKNCKEINYEQITLFNKPVLFTPWRIDRQSLPHGMHLYEVQHDDEQKGIMTLLSKHISVNHWGTIISNQPIRLDKTGYRNIDEDKDVQYPQKAGITLDGYMKLCPKKNKEKTR